MTTQENTLRDGAMLVVPFDNPVFPHRCIKTNQEVPECDYALALDCSSTSLYHSDARFVASAIGGKAGRTALALGEMFATRKKLPLTIGLCASKRSFYRKLKFGSFGLLAGGPLVAFAILIPLIQIAESSGTKPNITIAIIAAILGAALFITGIVLFAVANLGLLRPRKMNETHVWLDGASKEFLDSLPSIS